MLFRSIPEGDVGGRRPSQELELHDEGVACALRLVRPLVDALSHDYLPPRVGARPLARLAGRMTPAGKRPCRGCRQNADALEFPEGSPAALRESFRGHCAEASVGESSLPRRGGMGQRAEAAHGNGAMWSLRGLVCLCAGACGGGMVFSGSRRLSWATAWLCG